MAETAASCGGPALSKRGAAAPSHGAFQGHHMVNGSLLFSRKHYKSIM